MILCGQVDSLNSHLVQGYDMQTKQEIERRLRESAERIGAANKRAKAVQETRLQQEPNTQSTGGASTLSRLDFSGQMKGNGDT
jgi:hypothetical protein